jgi:ribosomal-protein-alanine N-acetyltransferase
MHGHQAVPIFLPAPGAARFFAVYSSEQTMCAEPRKPKHASLRPARPGDFEELWRIDHECFEPGISYSRAELAHYMQRKRAFTLVAESSAAEPQILGFIVAESGRSGAGHVITIDIRIQAQRSGIGSLLMSAAEEKLRACDCTAVYLETAVDNRAAIAFYKRLGYSVVGTIPRYYQGMLDAFVMLKKFPRS